MPTGLASFLGGCLVGFLFGIPGLGPAKVMKEVIVLGYAVIGLLEGFVVTTVWCQKKIASLNRAPTDRSP